ncbi:putative F-box protein At4g38870 [Coffea arabica]|uniref:F-box protein At4g38870 n=1 Tax=Coffea arabica TaxID=13443 RepID=A0A6P6WTR4_COFAR|nr:F-box protein At4g19940-like [Coffea arabica]
MKRRKISRPSDFKIPVDVVFDVLKRLPAKSLMRFKAVSKAWHCLICDPYFAESHQKKILQPHVLNLTTGEKMALPWTPLSAVNRYETVSRSYAMGFDPSTKKYVVIFILKNKENLNKECRILALGAPSWRKIHELPIWGLSQRNIYANGTIYWMDELAMNGRKGIHCFSVAGEKFEVLFGPEGVKSTGQLAQVRGCLAFLCLKDASSGMCDLWRMDRNKNKVWTKTTIQIKLWDSPPVMLEIKIIGSTKRGEILITVGSKWSPRSKLIVYDLETGKFRTTWITCPSHPKGKV